MLSFLNSQNTCTERDCIYNNLQNVHATEREKNTCFCAIERGVSNKQLNPFVNGPTTSQLTKRTYNGSLQGSSFDIYGDVK